MGAFLYHVHSQSFDLEVLKKHWTAGRVVFEAMGGKVRSSDWGKFPGFPPPPTNTTLTAGRALTAIAVLSDVSCSKEFSAATRTIICDHSLAFRDHVRSTKGHYYTCGVRTQPCFDCSPNAFVTYYS